MNSLFIVLPILTILMFDLGLTLEGKDFRLVMLRYKAVLAGMIGQLLLLPLIAWGVADALSLSPLFTIGLMLIACCPGGSSSNVFSMLAKGDVALSVSLTAVSSLITLFTVPLIMQATTAHLGEAMGVKLPVVNLLMQNVVTMLLPILLGIGVRHYWRETARKIERVLSRLAFPALMLLAGIFFVQHKTTIADNFSTLGLATTLLLLCATTGAHGHPRHHLRPDDERDPADLRGHHQPGEDSRIRRGTTANMRHGPCPQLRLIAGGKAHAPNRGLSPKSKN